MQKPPDFVQYLEYFLNFNIRFRASKTEFMHRLYLYYYNGILIGSHLSFDKILTYQLP